MCNCLEIFSGTGGLATGIGLSGINHTAFVEWNSDACETLRTNYDEKIVFEGDIRTYNFSQCLGVDIIAGGPTCQPFQWEAKQKGVLTKEICFRRQYVR